MFLYLGDEKIAEIKDTSIPTLTKNSDGWRKSIRADIERQLREQFEAQLPLMIDDIEKQVSNDSERSES